MTAEELLEATRELTKRWDNIRITGQGWSGDTRRGFQFNPIPTATNATTVTTSGACCPVVGDCFIATQAICEAGGGTYQGNNTLCDPDPCGCATCPPPWTCPDACTPPTGDCIHYVQFQVKLTQCDIDNDFSDLFEFGNVAGHAFDAFVSSGFWSFRGGVVGDLASIDISYDDVPLIACQCYDILVAFSDPGIGDPLDPNPVTIFFCVNGVSSSVEVNRSAVFLCDTISPLFVGAPYGGDIPFMRKYRRVVASPGFDLSVDSFDALSNASIIVEDGENVLLLDGGLSDLVYGEADIFWQIECEGC